MTLEAQKLELIQLILQTNDIRLFNSLWQIVTQKSETKKKANTTELTPRQFGFGKGTFTYVASDFDETPSGFEEYMIADELSH
jgi:hypothetical protein